MSDAGRGLDMRLHRWNAVNAEDEVVATITTSRKDRRVASAKIDHRFGDKSCFLRLEYAGVRK